MREKIEKLEAELVEFTRTDLHYSDMPRDQQRVWDLAEALFLSLQHLKASIENGGESPPDAKLEMADTFRKLSMLAEAGVLEETLSPGNAKAVRDLCHGLESVGHSLAEQGLRKKDMASYLTKSGDTDLLLEKHRQLDEAAAKKDRT
jgi:hypothetical protein